MKVKFIFVLLIVLLVVGCVIEQQNQIVMGIGVGVVVGVGIGVLVGNGKGVVIGGVLGVVIGVVVGYNWGVIKFKLVGDMVGIGM